ncbi:MAG: hypothetical protein VXW87_00935 [Pseudomonadota bacterium]|nr:hypothetical protein [Pseudomonadota bacterium]
MRVFHLTVFLLFVGLMYAALSSIPSGHAMFSTQGMVVDSLERFFDALLHVLGIAALIKYLYTKVD